MGLIIIFHSVCSLCKPSILQPICTKWAKTCQYTLTKIFKIGHLAGRLFFMRLNSSVKRISNGSSNIRFEGELSLLRKIVFDILLLNFSSFSRPRYFYMSTVKDLEYSEIFIVNWNIIFNLPQKTAEKIEESLVKYKLLLLIQYLWITLFRIY